jgi:hypothetical protein
MEILRQSEQWPDRTAAIQATQEHHLQDPHYDDYGPEENDWEAQCEAEFPEGSVGEAMQAQGHDPHNPQYIWHNQHGGGGGEPGGETRWLHTSPEEEVDTHYDPDHGREDRYGGMEVGGFDPEQKLQWVNPEGHHHGHYGGYETGLTEDELAAAHHHPVQQHDEIQIMRGKDTGLYGEDEDHPYDVIAKPNPKGDGYDVIKHL